MERTETMDRKRIVQKRTTLLQKLAYISRPFVVYMVVKTAAMLTLMVLLQALPVSGLAVWVGAHSYPVSAVVNAVASLVGAGFLLNDFLKEATVMGEVDIDAGVLKQLWDFFRNGFFGGKWIAFCAVLGVASAFGLNALLGALMRGVIGVGKYATVKQIQYSVPLGLGLVLYGIVSPFVEEIVFRGILYNRIKRFYGVVKAVFASALLFGAFHGNLPQFVYGTCMGALMAVCYERTGCFYAPLVFHAAANVAVFLATG